MDKLWLKLHEVFKEFNTNHEEIILKSSKGEIKITQVGGKIYFNRENLKKYLTKKEN